MSPSYKDPLHAKLTEAVVLSRERLENRSGEDA